MVLLNLIRIVFFFCNFALEIRIIYARENFYINRISILVTSILRVISI